MNQKPLNEMTVEEIQLAWDLNLRIDTRPNLLNELIRRAKEWEEFKLRNKEAWTIAGITLREMQNEKENC